MAAGIWVNIGSGNGMLPDGRKPLPEPLLTYHQWGTVISIGGQFQKEYLSHQWPILAGKLLIWKFLRNLPGTNATLTSFSLMLDVSVLHHNKISPSVSDLTHWGRVTHICVAYLTIIASDNGLSPSRRQAIIWTNAGILLIGPLGIKFSEILIKINTFSFKKMHLKLSSAKRRPFCLGLNELAIWWHGNMMARREQINGGKQLFYSNSNIRNTWCRILITLNWATLTRAIYSSVRKVALRNI